MKDIMLTKETGVLDIKVVLGDLQMVEADDELRQRVEFKLEFFQNDWFLDLLFGIPYYGRVFQRGVNTDDLYGIFALAISEEPGVAHVQRLDVNIDAQVRVLRVTGRAVSNTANVIELDSISGVV